MEDDCKYLRLELPHPVWKLAKKLQRIINVKLKAMGKGPLSLSNVITSILLNSLLEQAADIQDEYDQMGLDQLATQLADILGPEGLAAAGLPETPEVPNGARAHRRSRSISFFT